MNIPASIKPAYQQLPPAGQKSFRREYARRKKSISLAYLLWLLFGLHYLYLNRIATQLLFWITGGGLLLWWILDLARIPSLIARHNNDTARALMIEYLQLHPHSAP